MLLYVLQPGIELRGKEEKGAILIQQFLRKLVSTASCFEKYKVQKDMALAFQEVLK